jgi:membrane-anchored protein YejM (alkaline phosphatase superfamily)
MAFRMQTTVPEVMDITKEPAYIHEMYGTQLGKESFANNCLARKLVEQGVRFVQLFDWGWDSHGGGSEDTDVANGLTKKCSTVDKAITALIQDLKQRGLLDETLIVWGQNLGEPYGRKPRR